MKNGITLIKKSSSDFQGEVSPDTGTIPAYPYFQLCSLFSLCENAQVSPFEPFHCENRINSLLKEGYLAPYNEKSFAIRLYKDYDDKEPVLSVPYPMFTATRYHASAVFNNCAFSYGLDAVLKKIIETRDSEFPEVSPILIRVVGDSVLNPKRRSIVRFGIEFAGSNELKTAFWQAVNQDGASLVEHSISDWMGVGAAVNFNNVLPEEFDRNHIVLYNDNGHCHVEVPANSVDTDDERYKLAINSLSSEEGAYNALIKEKAYLSLPSQAKANFNFRTESLAKSKKILEKKGYEESDSEIYKSRYGLDPTLLLYLYQTLGPEIYNQVFYVKVPNEIDLNYQLFSEQNHFDLITWYERNTECREVVTTKKKSIAKSKKNKSERHIAVYTIENEIPNLAGVRKCTHRTSNNVGLFDQCLRFLSSSGRYFITPPFVFVECNEKQAAVIDDLLKLHPNKEKGFVIFNNKLYPLHRFGVGATRAEGIDIQPFLKNSLFQWNKGKCLSNITSYLNPDCSFDEERYASIVKQSFSETQIELMIERTFPNADIYHSAALIADTLKEGGVVLLMHRAREITSLFDMERNGENIVMTSKSHLHTPFKITFMPESCQIDVEGLPTHSFHPETQRGQKRFPHNDFFRMCIRVFESPSTINPDDTLKQILFSLKYRIYNINLVE